MKIISEQQQFIETQLNPYEYIQTYVNLYEKQRYSPLKVFPTSSKYYDEFQYEFINFALKHSTSIKEINILIDLLEHLKEEFSDFYNFCIETLFKGINLKLHELEISLFDLNNDYSSVSLLYTHTLFNIDFYPLIVYKALLFDEIKQALQYSFELVHNINKTIRRYKLCNLMENLTTKKTNGEFINLNDLNEFDSIIDSSYKKDLINFSDEEINRTKKYIKVKPGDLINGENRILTYTFETFLLLYWNKFKEEYSNLTNSDFYIKLIDLASEIDNYPNCDRIVNEIKKYADYILNTAEIKDLINFQINETDHQIEFNGK
ncbi:hypothetical protein HERIO_1295 [Hepatospora eriocheir]|uniref:Uncharacterized protein n=1 Tax=Hepatospora eriocheir TaxID=1081669 RepID=A0A1X0QAJ2_9MICR|nr:hypothetical protein HERIO_1295 [Hepatospora eriocheir]